MNQEKQQRNMYAVLTAEVLYSKELTPTQKILFAVISNLSNERGFCWASNEYLAEIMNCQKRSIQQNLSSLIERNLIGRVVELDERGMVKFRTLTPMKTITHGGEINFMSPHATDCMYKNKEKKNKEEKKINVDFELFWNLYDKKIGNKSGCIRTWQKLDDETRSKIMEVLPKWKGQFKDKQFQPYPSTFLNQERWNDEIETDSKPQENKPSYYKQL